MYDIPERIANVLLEVEAALRDGGKWETAKPPAEALHCEMPFCIDILGFEQWLQWVFLPRMRQILKQRRPLPRKSSIFPYAEEYLDKNDPATSRLLHHIRCFDELIAIQSAVFRH
jgi:uncharacterized protein YqcC (DUF446 family)